MRQSPAADPNSNHTSGYESIRWPWMQWKQIHWRSLPPIVRSCYFHRKIANGCYLWKSVLQNWNPVSWKQWVLMYVVAKSHDSWFLFIFAPLWLFSPYGFFLLSRGLQLGPGHDAWSSTRSPHLMIPMFSIWPQYAWIEAWTCLLHCRL